jgi:hypothetical protein
MTSRSRVFVCALALVCVAALASDRARAASFTLTLTTDPSLGTIADVLDASNNPGQVWTSAEIAFAPIQLDQGDDLTLNITLSGGLSIELESGAFFSGIEEVSFTLLPLAPGTAVSASSSLTSFSGLAGDLDLAFPINDVFSAVGQIGGVVAEDMTDTSFRFGGFEMVTTYTSLTGGPVTVSSVELIAAATVVNLVPEPSAALLLLGGLLAMAWVEACR